MTQKMNSTFFLTLVASNEDKRRTLQDNILVKVGMDSMDTPTQKNQVLNRK